MENMEIGYSDLRKKEKPDPQAGLRPRSKKSLTPGPDADDMPQVEKMPSDLETELSILQTVYDQALQAGLRAKKIPGHTPTGAPMLTLELHDVLLCPVCKVWTSETPCPVCKGK